MPDNKLQNRVTLIFLVFKESLILVFEGKNVPHSVNRFQNVNYKKQDFADFCKNNSLVMQLKKKCTF